MEAGEEFDHSAAPPATVNGDPTAQSSVDRYVRGKNVCASSQSRMVGSTLRRWRLAAGVSQTDLAARSELSRRWYWSIEHGSPTRFSTARRIVAALVAAEPDLGSASELADHLVALAAGVGLAPESPHADRIARRRARRWRRIRNKQAWADRSAQMAARPGGRALVREAKAAADRDDPGAFLAVLEQIEGAK